MGKACTSETNSRLVERALERARSGDREALGFLYARYSEEVYGALRGVMGEGPPAQEITRRVFAGLPRAIAGYGNCDAPFGAWVVSLARSVVAERVCTECPSLTRPASMELAGTVPARASSAAG